MNLYLIFRYCFSKLPLLFIWTPHLLEFSFFSQPLYYLDSPFIKHFVVFKEWSCKCKRLRDLRRKYMMVQLTFRDWPFSFPGTRAERICENLQHNFILHKSTINIFPTPSQSGKHISYPNPHHLGFNYCNPPTAHCGTGLLISVLNDIQRRWTTVYVSAIRLCALHSDMR